MAELQTFVRSFFMQALWNFERMQNVGFAFSVEPLLKAAHRSKDSFREALRRHCDYFNTHPYFAPIVMGVIYNKEKTLADSNRTEDPTLNVLKIRWAALSERSVIMSFGGPGGLSVR